MDMMTLAMAKPKVIDLREYSSGVTSFNDNLLLLLFSSLEDGGWARTSCEDKELALRKALKGETSATMHIRYHNLNANIYLPMSIIELEDYVVVASAKGFVVLDGTSIDVEIAIVWDRYENNSGVQLLLKATPVVLA